VPSVSVETTFWELEMETTTADLSAEISAFHGVIRAALHRGLTSEEQDALAQLIEAIRVHIGDQDSSPE
jgi:hypothetical protein